MFFGLWGFDVAGACELIPFLSHTAIKAGLCPASFATICQEMNTEREAVHRLLREQLAELGQVTGSLTLRCDVAGNIAWR